MPTLGRRKRYRSGNWDSRWHFIKNISVVSDTEAKGHALSFKDPSFAEIVGLELKDLTLNFRVKPVKEEIEAPIMWVVLVAHGKPPQKSSFRIFFSQKHIAIQREISQQGRTLALTTRA